MRGKDGKFFSSDAVADAIAAVSKELALNEFERKRLKGFVDGWLADPALDTRCRNAVSESLKRRGVRLQPHRE